MGATAIKVSDLKKTFRLPNEKSFSMKQAFINWVRGIRGYSDQQVLNGISFTVEKGDFLGIVGRNGSGKSTLLKLLSGIYVPDSGSIEINGSVVSFIELGVGFNPELTGHDNIYLNGALLGFSRAEIDAMYEDIVEFAGLHAFMNQKLKNYSSGMHVRLAFSCAIRAKSDILILDEVLAVGDEAFQRKCNDYFESICKDKNQTVVLVTHDMASVKRYCDRAIFIRDGSIVAEGDPNDVADLYSIENLNAEYQGKGEEHSDSRAAAISDFAIDLLSGDKLTEHDELRFRVKYRYSSSENTLVEFTVWDTQRNIAIYKDSTADTMLRGSGSYDAIYSCKISTLNDGNYKILAAICDSEGCPIVPLQGSKTPSFIVRRTDVVSLGERMQAGAINRRPFTCEPQ
jgi:ABC-2 type transport system ATP-binding protein